MAVLTTSRKERFGQVGDLFEGTEVVAIHRHRVVLRRAGQFECVYINKRRKSRSVQSESVAVRHQRTSEDQGQQARKKSEKALRKKD